MKIAGFDWDKGNWPKCGKHGVSRAEIEEVFAGTPAVETDPFPEEVRMRAIGNPLPVAMFRGVHAARSTAR